jgi:hypothetical protein
MSKIKEIVEGWRNDLIPPKQFKEAIKEMSAERIEICRKCPFDSVNAGIQPSAHRSEHCTICGCPLTKKTKSPTSQCPDNPPRWESYLSMAEYERLNKQLNA